MSLNNLLHLHLAKRTGQPASWFPDNRCTGQSTGIAFEALGEAMKYPRKRVRIIDHASTICNRRPDDWTWELAQSYVGRLQMLGFTFTKDHSGCYVSYDLCPDAK